MNNDDREKSENKTERLHMLISPTEIQAIDDWGYSHRIRSKAESVRRLCQIGLAYDRDGKLVTRHIARAIKATNLTLQKVDKAELNSGIRGGLAAILEELTHAYTAATAVMVSAELHSDGDDASEVDEIIARAEGYLALLREEKSK